MGSGAQVQQLWRTGLVALRHVEFSQTRDQAYVPCIGGRILNHCVTKEVPHSCFIDAVYALESKDHDCNSHWAGFSQV